MLRNYKICFVILHYQAYEMTLKCVDSIKKNMGGTNYKIIIVDNCSPNNSGDKLYKKFQNSDETIVILNEENLGFARGNNVGFLYAKSVEKADFICCINNDTLILQKDFYARVVEEYENTEFAVMAPLVYLKYNIVQNFNDKMYSIEYYQKEYNKWLEASSFLDFSNNLDYKARLFLKLGIIGKYIKSMKQFITRFKKNRVENTVLHGCFLIFSKKYINLFDGFDERTFMFREEELLYLRLKKFNLLSVYNPKIKIKHLEDIATNMSYTNNDEKFAFYKNNQLNSLNILISDLKKELSEENKA